ncbi:hypothetical protein LXL04_016270 [Taraxacum kok-saghyz]
MAIRFTLCATIWHLHDPKLLKHRKPSEVPPAPKLGFISKTIYSEVAFNSETSSSESQLQVQNFLSFRTCAFRKFPLRISNYISINTYLLRTRSTLRTRKICTRNKSETISSGLIRTKLQTTRNR